MTVSQEIRAMWSVVLGLLAALIVAYAGLVVVLFVKVVR